jgi:hypothetical protein
LLTILRAISGLGSLSPSPALPPGFGLKPEGITMVTRFVLPWAMLLTVLLTLLALTLPLSRDNQAIALGHPDPMWSRPPYEPPPPIAPEVWAPPTLPAWEDAPVVRGVPGTYMVEMSSHKSEAEAQAKVAALRRAFPHLLNYKPPQITRAKQGANGIAYRIVVGPFAYPGDAGAFCSGLKAAGGQCIVQRN